jgi:hypothetical protein
MRGKSELVSRISDMPARCGKINFAPPRGPIADSASFYEWTFFKGNKFLSFN